MEEGLYMGCGQVWYWDHKTWPHWNGGLTEEAFCARAGAFVEDPHQCFVHYEVNCRLLDFIAASPHLPPCFFSSSSSTTTSDVAALRFPSCRHQHLLARAPFPVGMSHRHQTPTGRPDHVHSFHRHHHCEQMYDMAVGYA
jgi:hypothetical protein